MQNIDRGSKIFKEIQIFLMEVENMVLKRCNFFVSLVFFRDVNDVLFIRLKKVVCFKEFFIIDVCIQRELFVEEVLYIEYVQKDIGIQTNFKYQRGVGNWEFISLVIFRSFLQEVEGIVRMVYDEIFR